MRELRSGDLPALRERGAGPAVQHELGDDQRVERRADPPDDGVHERRDVHQVQRLRIEGGVGAHDVEDALLDEHERLVDGGGLAIRLEDGGKHVHGVRRGDHADRPRPVVARSAPQSGDRLHAAVGGDDGRGFLRYALPRRGQLQRRAGALEQLDAQIVLERLDDGARALLGDVRRARRARDGPFLDDGKEQHDGFDSHSLPPRFHARRLGGGAQPHGRMVAQTERAIRLAPRSRLRAMRNANERAYRSSGPLCAQHAIR